MMVLIHVLIAMSGLASATLAAVSPSQKRLNATYALLAATLGSGTYLAVSTHAHILQACMEGLAYAGVVVVGVVVGKTRLVAQEN